VSVQISLKRRASWWIIAEHLIGMVLGLGGVLTDNVIMLVIGVWLVLQGQIQQMWDELLRGQS
jgi:hypothetical protein